MPVQIFPNRSIQHNHHHKYKSCQQLSAVPPLHGASFSQHLVKQPLSKKNNNNIIIHQQHHHHIKNTNKQLTKTYNSSPIVNIKPSNMSIPYQIEQDDKYFKVTIELPNDKQNLTVSVGPHGHVLRVVGRKTKDQKSIHDNHTNRFIIAFKVDGNVDTSNITQGATAIVSNNLLTVRLAKTQTFHNWTPIVVTEANITMAKVIKEQDTMIEEDRLGTKKRIGTFQRIVDVPGVKVSDLKVEHKRGGRAVRVSGIRQASTGLAKDVKFEKECRIVRPEGIDMSQLSATVDCGVLTIVAPRYESDVDVDNQKRKKTKKTKNDDDDDKENEKKGVSGRYFIPVSMCSL